MRVLLLSLVSFLVFNSSIAQENLPTDYLPAQFHKERREALRAQMSPNSVAVFFANAIRNRANDVDYLYHQDPDFFYLTGYREPHSVLMIFSEDQKDKEGNIYNEVLYVQERDALAEQWTGYRLGTEGAREKLGFTRAFNGKDFHTSGVDFTAFDTVYYKEFKNDYRNNPKDAADLFDLVESFKQQSGYYLADTTVTAGTATDRELKTTGTLPVKKATLDNAKLNLYMANLRQIKTEKELELLTKAVKISAMGQREVMKAMHPGMSETEIQGIHEYVFKRYGSEFEGYPSIVGAGHNGCVLHYMENNKTKVGDDLVLMDLGAEYHGYTADVTRTIPANGKFSAEQKAIYDLVYAAQEAGIKASVVGNAFTSTDDAAREVITEGLIKLGIAKNEEDAFKYFPHGTSHYIGLDVHDAGLYRNFEPNMVITVEPGIYIPEGSDCDPKWYGIAVRIEDDILITEDGPINLSADAPRKSEEIEALMKEKSPLDAFVLPRLDE